jgi:hypothetical protein
MMIPLTSQARVGIFETPRYVGNGKFTTSQRWANPRYTALKQVATNRQAQVVEAHLKQLSTMPIITKSALAVRYLGNLLKQGKFLAIPQHQAIYEFVIKCSSELQQGGNEGLQPERFTRMMNDYVRKYRLHS